MHAGPSGPGSDRRAQHAEPEVTHAQVWSRATTLTIRGALGSDRDRTRRRMRSRHTLWMSPTEGFAVSDHDEHSSQEHIPRPDEPSVPELEVDENIAPRPEEEIADVLRAKPDVADHSGHHP